MFISAICRQSADCKCQTPVLAQGEENAEILSGGQEKIDCSGIRYLSVVSCLAIDVDHVCLIIIDP